MHDDHGVDLAEWTVAVAYRTAYGFAVRRLDRLAIVNMYDWGTNPGSSISWCVT